jgi:hypothetical protein
LDEDEVREETTKAHAVADVVLKKKPSGFQ